MTTERAAAQVGGRGGVRAAVDGGRKRPTTDDVGNRSGGAALLLLLGTTPRGTVDGRDGRGARATRRRGDRRGRSRSRGGGRRARGRRTRIGVPAAARSESTSVEADDELRHSPQDVRQDRLAAVGRSGVSVERDLPEQEAHRGSHRQRRGSARRSGDAAAQPSVSARARPRASRGGALAKERVVDPSSSRNRRWPGRGAEVGGGRPSQGTVLAWPCGVRKARGRRRVGSGPSRQCRSVAGSAATALRRRRRWPVVVGRRRRTGDWAESASFIFGGRRALSPGTVGARGLSLGRSIPPNCRRLPTADSSLSKVAVYD